MAPPVAASTTYTMASRRLASAAQRGATVSRRPSQAETVAYNDNAGGRETPAPHDTMHRAALKELPSQINGRNKNGGGKGTWRAKKPRGPSGELAAIWPQDDQDAAVKEDGHHFVATPKHPVDKDTGLLTPATAGSPEEHVAEYTDGNDNSERDSDRETEPGHSAPENEDWNATVLGDDDHQTEYDGEDDDGPGDGCEEAAVDGGGWAGDWGYWSVGIGLWGEPTSHTNGWGEDDSPGNGWGENGDHANGSQEHGGYADGCQENGDHGNGCQENGDHANGCQENGDHANGCQENGGYANDYEEDDGGHANGCQENGDYANDWEENGGYANDYEEDDGGHANGCQENGGYANDYEAYGGHVNDYEDNEGQGNDWEEDGGDGNDWEEDAVHEEFASPFPAPHPHAVRIVEECLGDIALSGPAEPDCFSEEKMREFAELYMEEHDYPMTALRPANWVHLPDTEEECLRKLAFMSLKAHGPKNYMALRGVELSWAAQPGEEARWHVLYTPVTVFFHGTFHDAGMLRAAAAVHCFSEQPADGRVHGSWEGAWIDDWVVDGTSLTRRSGARADGMIWIAPTLRDLLVLEREGMDMFRLHEVKITTRIGHDVIDGCAFVTDAPAGSRVHVPTGTW